MAHWFGAGATHPWQQYIQLLLVFSVVHVLGYQNIPVLPLLAIVFGYVGVIATGRAWGANERQRSLIAKKLKDGQPDKLPDLRRFALLSSLQLAFLFPLLHYQLQRHFGLYHTPADASMGTWILFSFDAFTKAILDWSEIYGINFSDIRAASSWGKHFILLERLTFEFVLLHRIFRLLEIRKTIRDAVEAVGSDHELAVRLGQRAFAPLIEVLLDTERPYEERANAAKALGELAEHRAFEPLSQALRNDPHELVRETAAVALQQLARRDAVTSFVDALQDPFGSVRAAAAEALLHQGDRRAVEPLAQALQDEYGKVREIAAEALYELCASQAAPALHEALKDEYSSVRVLAAEALGQLRRPQSLPFLLDALQDSSGVVRKATIRALQQLGAEEAVEPLLQVLQHDMDGEVRDTAAEALGNLGNPKAVSPLCRLLQNEQEDPEVLIAVADALGKLGDKRAKEPLWKTLQEDYGPLRQMAAKALHKLGDEQALSPIIHTLRRSTKARLRRQAAEELGELGDQEAAEALIDALQDRKEEVRLAAAGSLARLQRSEGYDLLVETLMHPSAYQREFAILALGHLGDPRAVEHLLLLLEHEQDDDLRDAAAEVLGSLGDTKAVGPLLDYLHKYHGNDVNVVVVEVLGRLHDPRAVPPLLEQLEGTEPRSRAMIIEVLGKLRATRALEPIIQSLSHPHNGVRQAAALALGELRKDAAIGPLCDVALHDAVAHVRKNAVISLGRLRNKRAVTHLLTILNDPYERLEVVRSAVQALRLIGTPEALQALTHFAKALEESTNSKRDS